MGGVEDGEEDTCCDVGANFTRQFPKENKKEESMKGAL